MEELAREQIQPRSEQLEGEHRGLLQMAAHLREVRRAGEYQLLDDHYGASDSGCDSADEFDPVEDLEAQRLHQESDTGDEDVDCSDCEGAVGLDGLSDELTGGLSPVGSSGQDGSDEGVLSGGSPCASAEELVTDGETRYSSTTLLGDDQDLEGELSEDSPSLSPDRQRSGEWMDCNCSAGDESSGAGEPRDGSTQ
ncbi:uncharacterized protein LOC126355465 [Schistocerca gregaria]|uniref:uncharacterized protein LOC126355465 n=1 Tax=Schistocerca gregaria TaxID=7010 RepID=UPI00211E9791|nr:uncharacterized protein LOC126355465 [Schistocerca gregaria]